MKSTGKEIDEALREFLDGVKKVKGCPLSMIEVNDDLIESCAQYLTDKFEYPMIAFVFQDKEAFGWRRKYQLKNELNFCVYPLPQVTKK